MSSLVRERAVSAESRSRHRLHWNGASAGENEKAQDPEKMAADDEATKTAQLESKLKVTTPRISVRTRDGLPRLPLGAEIGVASSLMSNENMLGNVM